jgi:hypothetical protein
MGRPLLMPEFHAKIMQAFDTGSPGHVRAENKRLQGMGDDRRKGTQRLFGYHPDYLKEDDALCFSEIRDPNLLNARAWGIKCPLNASNPVFGGLILCGASCKRHGACFCHGSACQAPPT